MTSSECRYGTKKVFATEAEAVAGSEAIRAKVTAAGGQYTQLYPYLCPDAEHWHLSHYEQGHATCPECGQRAPAWNGGQVWVMSAHAADAQPCSGTGSAGSTGAR